MRRIGWALGLVLVVAFGAQHASAQSIRTGFDSNTFAGNDDGSVANVGLGFNINFFGDMYSSFALNNNGNITFDGTMSTYTPFNLSTTGRVIIAPFFADVDTRDLNPVQYGSGTVNGHAAFGVNWLGVGHYLYTADNKQNYFQLVIIDRSDTGAGNFDFEFNYGSIQWETGGASGDSNGDGICQAAETSCVPARVGWNAGNGVNTFELAGSAMAGYFLDGGPGELNGDRYLFQVRNGQVENPQVVPEPITMVLLGSGLAGIGGVRMRRRRNADELDSVETV